MGDIISAPDLGRQKHDGLSLPGAYGELLGAVPPNFNALVWGPKGKGKTTLVLGLCAEWARRVGPVLYVGAEEGHGAAFSKLIRRLGAGVPGLHIATYDPGAGLSGIVADLRQTGAGLVAIDSISWIDPHSAAFGEFAVMLREAGVALVYIAHAQKGGKDYLGPSRVGHAVDTVVKVDGGQATTEKNRHAPEATINVPFTAARANPAPGCGCQSCTSCGGTVRANPPHSGACAYAKRDVCECRCGGRLHGSTITRVKGAAKTAGKQTAQGRAVMASLTKSGKKKVKPGAGRSGAGPKGRTATGTASATKRATTKAAPRKAAPKKRAASRPAPKKSGVAAQLAALRKQIGNL